MVQQLKDRYNRYLQESRSARENAPALGGYLGFGEDPRKDPCHKAFYQDVAQWVEDFLATDPDGESVYQAVEWILLTPTAYRQADAYWFMYAAQGLCKDLIPLLNGSQCAALAAEYDREFPRRDRLTAQNQVYKALSKGARKK